MKEFIGQKRKIYASENEFVVDSEINGTDCYKCFYTNGDKKGQEHHFSHWFIDCKSYEISR